MLDTDWLSPLMCNEKEMLFSIIRVVKIWYVVWYIGWCSWFHQQWWHVQMFGGRDPNYNRVEWMVGHDMWIYEKMHIQIKFALQNCKL